MILNGSDAMRAQGYGSRPGQTAHCLQVRDRKLGAVDLVEDYLSTKLVIHVKYGIGLFIKIIQSL